MKTCLGYIDCFLKHAKNEVNSYDLSDLYRNTFLYFAGGAVANTNKEKANARAREKQEAAAKAEREKGHDVVTRRLQEIMESTVGLGHGTANYLRVRKNEDTGRYGFWVGAGSDYNMITRQRGPDRWTQVATRVDGQWVLRHDWDENDKVYQTVGTWGGDCAFCHLDGHRGHSDKKGHRSKLTKAMFLGLQATSQAGMRLRKEADAQDKVVEFKYRKNSKNILGVKLEPAPRRVYDTETMEFHDAPSDTSY
jgi:hypothetical protein